MRGPGVPGPLLRLARADVHQAVEQELETPGNVGRDLHDGTLHGTWPDKGAFAGINADTHHRLS